MIEIGLVEAIGCESESACVCTIVFEVNRVSFDNKAQQAE